MKSILVTLALLAGATSLRAQTPVVVPSEFATAKTVFIGNAGGIAGDDEYAQNGYTAAFQALAKDGHYKIVTTPQNADLVLEISYTKLITDVTHGSSYNIDGYVMTFIDPKSHTTLWTVTAHLDGVKPKSFADAAAKMIARIDTLITGNLPTNFK